MPNKKPKYMIGIDPGVNTGLAVWDTEAKKFDFLGTFDILTASSWVMSYHCAGDVFVRIENPNLRKWFGKTGRERLQGVGSVKRDYSIWKTFLTKNGIPFEGYAPKSVITKMDSATFKKITGYKGRTSGHARDAALSVYNY